MTRTWLRIACTAGGTLAVLGALALPAQAATAPAAGTGLTGACNMLRDASMGSVPMAHDADQGNAGMWHAVDASGCL